MVASSFFEIRPIYVWLSCLSKYLSLKKLWIALMVTSLLCSRILFYKATQVFYQVSLIWRNKSSDYVGMWELEEVKRFWKWLTKTHPISLTTYDVHAPVEVIQRYYVFSWSQWTGGRILYRDQWKWAKSPKNFASNTTISV